MNDTLREKLLDLVSGAGPASFEKPITDLMLGLGYETDKLCANFKRTVDGEIEGDKSQDSLGSDVIHLRARKNSVRVGVEKIREFAGALDERGTTKGVFITTGEFDEEAVSHAQNSSKRLVLIDGDELTRLLVKHGVAVRCHRTIELVKIDADYFDEADG